VETKKRDYFEFIKQMKSDMTTGRARELRERAGLSRSEVARALGTSSRTIYKWERDQRAPMRHNAVKYARLLARWRAKYIN
jgi:DNA-binding transcriptional regulator YiaG